MIGRMGAVLRRPAAAIGGIVASPRWLGPWLVILAVWAACAGALLGTAVGQQALVDEEVRRTEAFGGTVSDAEYAGWLNEPPLSAYLASGGRMLLTPPVTLAVAVGLFLSARAAGGSVGLAQALAVAVYASVPLLLGQVIATPLHYVRESLTSPFTLAALVPLADEGTWPARVMGTIDVFGLWWAWLLAVGLGVLTGRPARRYLTRVVGLYLAVAAIMAAALMIWGGF